LWARLEFALPDALPTVQVGALREENPR